MYRDAQYGYSTRRTGMIGIGAIFYSYSTNAIAVQAPMKGPVPLAIAIIAPKIPTLKSESSYNMISPLTPGMERRR